MKPTTTPPAAYFVSLPFDVAFVGGISLVVFLAVKLSGFTAYSERAMTLSIWLMWVVNWPHFSATIFRLFRSRENAREFPVTAFLVPVVVGAGAMGALASPSVIAPFFVKLFLVWSPYHFSGQTVGVSLIYARRAGLRLEPWQRLALSAFIFGTYATSTLSSEVSVAGSSYYGIEYPGLGVPPWLAQAAQAVMYGAALVFAAFAVRWTARNRRVFPPMVLLPAVTQYVWFIAGASMHPFYIFVPLFHSLQYLPIAWAMQMGERVAEIPRAPTRAFFARETVKWLAVNLAGGAVLFWGLPHLAAALGVPLSFATGVLIAGVQIHHFFVDGVIWKLRNRKVASPLTANVGAYLRGRETPPARAAA